LLDDLEATLLYQRLHRIHFACFDGIGLDHGVRALRGKASPAEAHGSESLRGRNIRLCGYEVATGITTVQSVRDKSSEMIGTGLARSASLRAVILVFWFMD
jgi:hypothetical protein